MIRPDPTTAATRWRIISASARGASHLHNGAPNQDAELSTPLGDLGQDAFVVALADGHGDRRHFRSDRGSRFAVECACRCATPVARSLIGMNTEVDVADWLRASLVEPIVNSWQKAVDEDVTRDPFTEIEAGLLEEFHSSAELAYGSTLLVAMLCQTRLLLAQIGDGNIVVLYPDGGIDTPVPGDDRLDGHQTTSLCQPKAAEAFRLASVDCSKAEMAGVLLATDGFGNAQVADPWEPAVGADLVEMMRDRGLDWIEQQIPAWVEECASAGGSADDSTLTLVLTTEVGAFPPKPAAAQLEDTDRTEHLATTVAAPGRSSSVSTSGRRAPDERFEKTVQVDAVSTAPPQMAVSPVPPLPPPAPLSSSSHAPPSYPWRWIVLGAVAVVAVVIIFLIVTTGGSAKPGSPRSNTPSTTLPPGTTPTSTTPATKPETTRPPGIFGQSPGGTSGSTGSQSPATSPSVSSGSGTESPTTTPQITRNTSSSSAAGPEASFPNGQTE